MGKSNNSKVFGFAGLLTIVFVILKLCGVIKWSWLWVLAPLWVSFAFWLFIFLVVIIILLINEK